MNKAYVTIGAAWVAAGLLTGAAGGASAAIQTLPTVDDLCIAATKKAETEAGIPRHLLTAISLAESGRWDQRRRASFSWPWTVTNGGKSMYFPSREEAIGAVETLLAKGATNIDVGCMQINLHYHPNAFQTLQDAFDPTQNVAYAARFLAGLYSQKDSWAEAAATYHSSNPERNGPYRDRVMALWEKVSGRQHTELGRIETIEPEISEAALREIQTRALNDRFRARLEAERTAPKNSRALAQLDEWRQKRHGHNYRQETSAARSAIVQRQRDQELTTDTRSFEEKRRAQLEAWRQTRSGAAFR